jgi:polyisoprenoid-binding protein YceI
MSQYVIDPLHSDIEFNIKHLMISTVRGRFSSFTATMEAEAADFSDLKVEFSADIDSIATGVADRDAHLKTVDFFDSAQWPKLTFVSTGIERSTGDSYVLRGNMTIRDQTRPIELALTYNGSDTDPWGNLKHGFEMTGELSRKNFGLSFAAVSGGGNALVGDIVKLVIGVQMTKVA